MTAMWGASKLVTADAGGRALARFGAPTDFVVGVDNPFIQLSRALRLGGGSSPPSVADVDANLLIDLGILGSTHLIDCSADDPSNFRFLQYGNRIAIHDGKEYSGRTLRDAEWRLVRDLAERDYAYAKSNAAVTLAQVELLWHGREIVYRRYIVPLAGDRGEISHLLVATRPNLLKVVPSSFD